MVLIPSASVIKDRTGIAAFRDLAKHASSCNAFIARHLLLVLFPVCKNDFFKYKGCLKNLKKVL
jgi:hypothetical protein